MMVLNGMAPNVKGRQVIQQHVSMEASIFLSSNFVGAFFLPLIVTVRCLGRN